MRAYMSASGRNRGVKLVGLIFCQPHTKFSKDEILPGLRYFHYRSGERVNFYFPGYGEGFEAKPGEILVSQRLLGSMEDLTDAESMGELTLKGFHRPVTAYNIVRLKL